MPLDIAGVVDYLIESGQFSQVVNAPQAQFGTREVPLLGASILPEKPQDENFYEESGIRYRSIIANDSTRYSPVQLKSGILVGSFEVRLGDQDTGSHFTAKDYDTFVKLLKQSENRNSAPAMTAMNSLLRWVDTQVNIPLRHKIEKQRWEAIVSAQIVRQGNNGYYELVTLPNPTGQRVASGNWQSASYDPLADIFERARFLHAKGYTISRIVTSFQVRDQLLAHPIVLQRLGFLSIAGGTVVGLRNFATTEDLNSLMSRNALPPIETYDYQYQTDTGSQYFLARNTMVFIAATGRDEEIYLGPDEENLVMPNTLGYVGIGTAAGQNSPGRVVKVESFDRKPPRIEAEGWQVSLPVVAEPEAIAVLTAIPVGAIT